MPKLVVLISVKSNDSNIEKGEYAIVIQKNSIEKDDNEYEMSIEAMIIDAMVKNNCSMKEAINIINKDNKNLKKNDIYSASLNLKNMFER